MIITFLRVKSGDIKDTRAIAHGHGCLEADVKGDLLGLMHCIGMKGLYNLMDIMSKGPFWTRI